MCRLGRAAVGTADQHDGVLFVRGELIEFVGQLIQRNVDGASDMALLANKFSGGAHVEHHNLLATGRHFLSAMRGQAVHEDRVLARFRHDSIVDDPAGEIGAPLRRFLVEQFGPTQRIAVVIVFIDDKSRLDMLANTIRQRMKGALAYDLVLLSKNEVERLATARKHLRV